MKKPNKAPEPTPLRITPRGLRTSRATQRRGSSLTFGKMKAIGITILIAVVGLSGCVVYPTVQETTVTPKLLRVVYNPATIALETNVGVFIADRHRSVPLPSTSIPESNSWYYPMRVLAPRSSEDVRALRATAEIFVPTRDLDHSGLVLDTGRIDPRIAGFTEKLPKDIYKVVAFPPDPKRSSISPLEFHPYSYGRPIEQRDYGPYFIFFDAEQPSQFEILVLPYAYLKGSKTAPGVWPNPLKGIDG